MSPRGRRTASRGVSELVGISLLFGLVMAGAALVILGGVAVQDQVSQQNRMKTAETSMQNLDAGIGSLSREGSGPTSIGVDLTDRDAESISIREDDTLRVTINGNSACTATVPLDAVRYDVNDVGTVTYQAGGVFRGRGESATVVNSPAIDYESGTLQIDAVTIHGNPGTDMTVYKNVAASANATQRKRSNLFGEADCYRPDRVAIEVVSEDLHAAWYRYFRDAMPANATITHDPSTNSVTVVLDQALLDERADDDRNHVVDFGSDDELGRIEDVDGDGSPELVVDKPDDANEYDATAKVLGSYVSHTEDDSVEVPRYVNKTVPDYGIKKIPFLLQIDPDDSGHPVPITNPWHYVKRFNHSLEGLSPPVYLAIFADNAKYTAPPRPKVGSGAYEIHGSDVVIDPGPEPTNDVWVLYKPGCHRSRLKFIGESASYDNEILLENRTIIPNTNTASVGYYSLGGDRCVDGRKTWRKKRYLEGYKEKRVRKGNETIRIHRIVRPPVDVTLSTPDESKYVVRGATPPDRAVNYRRTVPTNGLEVDDGDPVNIDATFHTCDDSHYVEVGKVAHGGRTYNRTVCTKVTGASSDPENVLTYTDGDAVPTASTPWYQRNLSSIVGPEYTDGSGHFDLDGNQVVVVFEYDDAGTSDYNNVVVLYEAGTARSEAPGDWIVDLGVTDLTVSEEDADR